MIESKLTLSTLATKLARHRKQRGRFSPKPVRHTEEPDMKSRKPPCATACDMSVDVALLGSAFDLRRCHGDAITILQGIIRSDWLAVDPDQIVSGFAGTTLVKETVDRCVRLDLDVVGKAGSVVVDE